MMAVLKQVAVTARAKGCSSNLCIALLRHFKNFHLLHAHEILLHIQHELVYSPEFQDGMRLQASTRLITFTGRFWRKGVCVPSSGEA